MQKKAERQKLEEEKKDAQLKAKMEKQQLLEQEEQAFVTNKEKKLP